MKLRDRLYPLAAGLLEPVPLKGADTAEEFAARLAVLFGLVLDQSELDCAEAIRHLLEAIVGHRGLAVPDDRFGDAVRLVVKDEREQIVASLAAAVAALVDEDAEFLGQWGLLME